MHPQRGLCMFNLTPGATPGLTERLKISRLFVDEEGVYCASIHSPTSPPPPCVVCV